MWVRFLVVYGCSQIYSMTAVLGFQSIKACIGLYLALGNINISFSFVHFCPNTSSHWILLLSKHSVPTFGKVWTVFNSTTETFW